MVGDKIRWGSDMQCETELTWVDGGYCKVLDIP